MGGEKRGERNGRLLTSVLSEPTMADSCALVSGSAEMISTGTSLRDAFICEENASTTLSTSSSRAFAAMTVRRFFVTKLD